MLWMKKSMIALAAIVLMGTGNLAADTSAQNTKKEEAEQNAQTVIGLFLNFYDNTLPNLYQDGLVDGCEMAQMTAKGVYAFRGSIPASSSARARFDRASSRLLDEAADMAFYISVNNTGSKSDLCLLPVEPAKNDFEVIARYNAEHVIKTAEVLNTARALRLETTCDAFDTVSAFGSALSSADLLLSSGSHEMEAAMAAMSALSAAANDADCVGRVLEKERCCKVHTSGLEFCVNALDKDERCGTSQADPDNCHVSSDRCSGGGY